MDWQFLAVNLPHVTAGLNTLAIFLLLAARFKIKSGNVLAHKRLMLSALTVSGLFLLLYLFHKVALLVVTGEPNQRFPTDESVAPLTARYFYYALLGSHLVLAITVPYFALRSIFLAMKGRVGEHRKIVRYAFPIWIYVSITGVMVYLMLYQIYDA
jgi:putative membrane protein